jgi:predicted alpha/beta-hydrolase family hydrolase
VDISEGATTAGDGRQVLTSALDYPTLSGNVHVEYDVPMRPLAVLVLGHGAGGDIDAPDLLAVRDAALPERVAVLRVRQPYRVLGRKAPAPAAQLDQAFSAVLARIAELPGLSDRIPVLVGGRSSGARVAARTAAAAGAAGLLALAFPLSPPGRPLVSRLDELTGAGVPTLVVQGARDGFGSAADLRAALGVSPVEVVEIADADHSFRTRKVDPTTTAQSLAAVAAAVVPWLRAYQGSG